MTYLQHQAGRKNGDNKKQTEESRKKRELEEAIPNKKGESQQEVRTERQLVRKLYNTQIISDIKDNSFLN